MSLNRPEPPSIGSVAKLLAMDRTTLTAAIKPLERRRLVKIVSDPKDKRRRRLQLTVSGHKLLKAAVPVWKQEHAAIERRISDPAQLRGDLRAIS